MSKIEIKRIKDDIYGNLVYITNGIVELKASLDFGPRILHLSLNGMENMMYNDLELKPINNTEYPQFGGGILRVAGGHRVWAGPEVMPKCYYPDNYPVTLTETERGVILEAPVEIYNNIQKKIEICLNEYNAEVDVINTIQNVGMWDIVFAPWAITALAPGGIAVVPYPDRDTGYLSNKFLALWPYAKMNDRRVNWGDKFIILSHDENMERPFKLGLNNEKQWAAYFNRGQLYVKGYEHVADGFYPDFAGCSFEMYTNKYFTELESLGQTGVVAPMASVSHREKWLLFNEGFIPSSDEDAIEAVMKKYLD